MALVASLSGRRVKMPGFFTTKIKAAHSEKLSSFPQLQQQQFFSQWGQKLPIFSNKRVGNYLLSCIYGFTDYSQTNGKIYVCSKKPKMLPQRVIELDLQLFRAPSLGLYYFEYPLA